MKVVKKYMVTAMLLMVYMVTVTILIRSYYVFQDAYHNLSRLISHSSVEIQYEEEE